MNILSYSPKVEAYACVGSSPFKYIDLSQDIVSACVTRVQDGASTFSIRLQNGGGKYFDVFTPMDRVKVYATKSERVPLILGYITSTPKFSIYGTDLEISGMCSIYRLEQLYWDPQLWASQKLMGSNSTASNWDDVLINLLTEVAGYDESQIMIGKMPQGVIEWACELYAMKADDAEQARQMVDEFYEVLQTHGPKFSSSGATASSYGGAVGSGMALLDGVDFSMSENKFVELWSRRIDGFYEWYSGTAGGMVSLYGHGEQFARSAYRHKVDPRLSPCISIVESGGGQKCFKPYNAWGWMSANWNASSWDDAIEIHVNGLAEVYSDLSSIRDVVYRYLLGVETPDGYDLPVDEAGNDPKRYIENLTEYFDKMTNS